MNISSVVIYLSANTDVAAFRKELQSIGGCEFVACENGKAVATISVESFDDEIAAFRAIEAIKGVSEAMMIYSYSDLDADITAANSDNGEQIMRELDEKDPSQIKYSGKVQV